MVSIRRGTFEDFEQIRNCNLWCLPENYNSKYFYYHFLTWSHLLYVAEDTCGKIVGYVLAKADDVSVLFLISMALVLILLSLYNRLKLGKIK
jgi:peptide alpha-N-acetyltransferase